MSSESSVRRVEDQVSHSSVFDGMGDEGRQRCSISQELASKLDVGVGRHIRVDAGLPAYFIVDEIHEDDADVLVGEDGRERIDSGFGDTVSVSSRIPLESEVMEARRRQGFTETLWDEEGSDVLFVASHGGDVEWGTDDIAIRSYNHVKDDLSGRSASAWMCHGFGPEAFSRWHTCKPCKSIESYPGLQKLDGRVFDHVVGFHMQDLDYIGVGGCVDDGVRVRCAELLRERLPDSKKVVSDLDEMALTGRHELNSVNYFAKDGGLHLELTPNTLYKYRKRVARAVRDLLSEL